MHDLEKCQTRRIFQRHHSSVVAQVTANNSFSSECNELGNAYIAQQITGKYLKDLITRHQSAVFRSSSVIIDFMNDDGTLTFTKQLIQALLARYKTQLHCKDFTT